MFRMLISLLSSLILLVPLSTAQSAPADYSGMWSDPPDTPEGLFCFFSCSDYALEVLERLLDDPVNDDRPYGALTGQANREFQTNIVALKLTDAARATYPRDPAQDPGFLRCEPWKFARQIFSPHQNEITLHADSIEMHYGEWDTRRRIYTDGRTPPANLQPSRLGFSTGRFEGDTLIVDTTHISEGILMNFNHSDQLTAEERYTISDNGQILTLYVSFQDPWALKDPLILKKIWKFSPDEEIYPYNECEIPTDYIESQGAAR